MRRRTLLQNIPGVATIPVTAWADLLGKTNMMSEASTTADRDRTNQTTAEGVKSDSVYELRVYHTYEGKLEDLLRRFREHTTRLFERHGIKNVAYWVPLDEPAKSNTLIYILEHPSREEAAANWKAFQGDPEWKDMRDKSEEKGKIVEKVDSTFMVLTDFSGKVG